jgi:hypothetical protein
MIECIILRVGGEVLAARRAAWLELALQWVQAA